MKNTNRLTVNSGVLLLAFLPTMAFAGPVSKDTITTYAGNHIYIIENQPSKMKLMVNAQLMNIECGMGDLCKFSVGLKGDIFLPKLFSVTGSYTQAAWGLKKMDFGSNNITQNDYVPFRQIEAGGRFHFVDKNGRAKHKIVLFSHTTYGYNSTTTWEKSITTKLPCRRIWAARGGLYMSTATVSSSMSQNDEIKVGTIKTKDGMIVSDYAYTGARSYGFYAGLSNIYNMRVRSKNDVPSYEENTYISSIFREAYADVIIAGTTFDDFKINGASHPIEANAKGSFITNNIGWRIGKVLTRTKSLINLSYTFEVGNRPGIKYMGYYFSSGLNIAFVK